MITLSRALRLSSTPRVVFVGAGGKTSALFYLAREFTTPVLVTATTKMALDQLSLADRYFFVEHPNQVDKLNSSISGGVNLILANKIEADKVQGVDHSIFERLLGLADAHQYPLLVEADGSRMLPLKAPADHEPDIPAIGYPGADWLDAVVVVAGLQGLFKPLSNEWVHRPEHFAAICGLKMGEVVTIEALARVLTHPEGGLKGIPQGVRRIVLLNQADTANLQSRGQSLARLVLPSFEAVVITALNPSVNSNAETKSQQITGDRTPPEPEPSIFATYEPVGGIILAAGESSRLGEPKQLLSWKGEPLIRHIVRTALSTGLDQVVVVTGAYADQVERLLDGMEVGFARNPDWKMGQSSSVRTGLSALKPGMGAAIFMLADQPNVPPDLIRLLMETRATSLSPIVAPQVDGQRANPVLFDRDTFSALNQLEGDVGGRILFSRYPIQWVTWHDRDVLLDVDTAEDYRRLVEGSGDD
jgi:molybdenum cofactor cytidylyltransferase